MDQIMPGAHTAPPLPGLTGRQLDVLRLICRDQSNKEIAAQLGISPATAKVHVSRILSELRLDSREAAFRFCLSLVEREITDGPGQISRYGFLNGIRHPLNCACAAVFCDVMRRLKKG